MGDSGILHGRCCILEREIKTSVTERSAMVSTTIASQIGFALSVSSRRALLVCRGFMSALTSLVSSGGPNELVGGIPATGTILASSSRRALLVCRGYVFVLTPLASSGGLNELISGILATGTILARCRCSSKETL